MIRRLLVCVPLLAILSACQSEQAKTPHYNFVLDPTDHNFAFETTTGVLCTSDRTDNRSLLGTKQRLITPVPPTLGR
jgi:ABC-type uncharacterized transport system auxiliary subunit